jgi:V/A-type H+-transporting ATPase subunit D
MAKIKFTKTELKLQQDLKRQFVRFLPTLQLKKQQLQFEVRQSTELLESNRNALLLLEKNAARIIALFADDSLAAEAAEKIKIKKVICGMSNIAGVNIPTFDHVDFYESSWDLFATDWVLDDLISILKEAVELRCAGKILEEQHRLLSDELRSTTQRVNLFEKVKIPECNENIRRINIMLGDANTSSVARSKIAKKKSLEAVAL